MVKSELNRLEKLIGEIVDGERNSGNDTHRKELREKIKSAVENCALVKEKLLQQLFGPLKEHAIARYIQYHQAGITSLSNQVSLSIPFPYIQDSKSENHQDLALLLNSLEDLLQFLRRGFYKYFDHDHEVSIVYCQTRTELIRQVLAGVVTELGSRDVDPLLISAIETSVDIQITDARLSGISYRKLDYCKYILNIIKGHINIHSPGSTIEIARKLYSQNFNSYHFNQWYQDYLSSIINAAADDKREAIILQEIKLLKLTFVERKKIFDPGLPAIADQLLPWLQQLVPGSPTLNLKDILIMNGHNRMPLQFSVTQFALFIRLCYLEGCFHVNNISDILRFFTQHFETKKQLNISFKSFARSFYCADQPTAAVVRDFLQRMINTINKIYFP